MQDYNNDSIKSLGVLGGVRAKPASIGIENHNHTFVEILANSIDESAAGFGNVIVVTKHEDGAVTIRDYGRGVPMGKNNNGEWAYKKVFDELWSGSKYENNGENSNYKYSLGTNGLGSCAVNYTSDYFEALSYKEKEVSYVRYEKGIEETFDVAASKGEKTGTEIRWKPSAECFRGKGEIDDDFIVMTLQDQSIVNGGIKFIFNKKDGESEEYYYEDGVKGFMQTILNEEQAINDIHFVSTELVGKDNELDEDYKIKADVYFAFNKETSYDRYYHNSSWLEDGGTPEEFIKNSFTYVIDRLIKEHGLYTKTEKKISFEDISDSLVLVCCTYSTISLFTTQGKKKIDSDFMKQSITSWLREQLHVYFLENPEQAKLIAAQVLINMRSREKAEKMRSDVKKKLSATVNNITSRVDGFVNCKVRDNTKSELYLVEGKSALGSTQQGRDEQIQAIYALRGKILNCLKADYDKIFKNDIIIDLIRLFGCGVEIKSKYAKDLAEFNINNLRWSKIIITTDADVDGYHIRILILTLIFRLMPSLILEGKVFIAESPLYEIEQNEKSVFAYTDAEKDEIIAKMSGNFTVERSKGLGENTPEMMWETTMNPETRRLIKITMDDMDEVIKTFEMFMGDDLDGRKKYIEDNLYMYVGENLD